MIYADPKLLCLPDTTKFLRMSFTGDELRDLVPPPTPTRLKRSQREEETVSPHMKKRRNELEKLRKRELFQTSLPMCNLGQ